MNSALRVGVNWSGCCSLSGFFFFDTPATSQLYTLSLHDALPICAESYEMILAGSTPDSMVGGYARPSTPAAPRSEEHTSELQSHSDLVCRLLLEKKKAREHPRRKLRPASQSARCFRSHLA